MIENLKSEAWPRTQACDCRQTRSDSTNHLLSSADRIREKVAVDVPDNQEWQIRVRPAKLPL